MKNISILLLIMFLITLLVGCAKSTSSDNNNFPVIYGQITNQNQQPVDDAKIILTYKVEELLRPTTTIFFDIKNPSNVKVWITRHNETDTLKVLANSFYEPGIITILWDGKDKNDIRVVSGYYDYYSCIDEGETTMNKMVVFYEPNNVTGDEVAFYEAHTITGNGGDFLLSTEKLPFSFDDNEFEILDESGNLQGEYYISRYVKIYAIHKDYLPIFVDSVYIDSLNSTRIDFQFNE